MMFIYTLIHPCSKSFGHACFNGKNSICEFIVSLNQRMPLSESLALSNSFYRIAKKYQLDPMLLVSIGFQESSLKLDAVRKSRGFIWDETEYREVAVASDFCMMQINISNIKAQNIDIDRILTEADYCIEAGAKILKGIERRYSRTETTWWTRYNSVSQIHRDIYEKHIQGHLEKIIPLEDQIKNATAKNSQQTEKYSKRKV